MEVDLGVLVKRDRTAIVEERVVGASR